MIGPIGTPATGTVYSVRLKPSGVEVPTPPLPRAASSVGAEPPPVDAGKIAALQAAIADGSYRVDPYAIATKMIEADLSGE